MNLNARYSHVIDFGLEWEFGEGNMQTSLGPTDIGPFHLAEVFPMNDSSRIVPVQFSLCPNNYPTHWILFDVETTILLDVHCVLCGPRAIVKRNDPVKSGFVSRTEKDRGYALDEPEKDEDEEITMAT